VSRVAYLDCSSGASGDMLLGALVDLGLSLDALRAELSRLPLRGYRLEARKVHRSGLHATKVDVVVETEHGHGHDHDHGHAHGHGEGHAHRGLREILDLIDTSALDPAVKERSARLFRRLAEAEAAVHGTRPEDVHFHEVGAVDSIVDIVGGVVGLTWLHADRVVASPLNVGTGTVSMSHGVYPVPPPATALLVQGVPVYGAGDGELLTPTGALLVTGHATAYGPLPALRSEGIGHGAGSRDTPGRPNVLRLIVGEEAGAPAGQKVVVLEAEMDDLSPQLCAPLMDRLFGAGALDVYYTPIQMKKGRPGILVTALVEPGRREAAEEVLFAEATTLGVRRQEWERTVLDREVVAVETPYGTVGVKVGHRGGRIYNAQPEFDDCQRAATASGVAVKEVWAAALAAYRSRNPRPS
jgi:pyridinium-3,5-bisthiocarboxylic acid mononucleotide nickel chelatase